MRIKNTVVLGLCSAFIFNSAYAQSCKPLNKGFYARLSGGVSLKPGVTVDDSSTGLPVLQNSTYKHGFDADFAGGYRFESNFRAELALGYITNQLNANYSNTSSKGIAGGKARAYTAFANGYYNFDTCSHYEPYLGLGVGYVDPQFYWNFNPSSSSNNYQAIAKGIGFQGIAGLAYRATPQFSVLLDYRYLSTLRKTVTFGNTADLRGSVKYTTNLINLGFSYMF